jgi:hypothetical protein
LAQSTKKLDVTHEIKMKNTKTGLLDLSGSHSVALNCVMCSTLSLSPFVGNTKRTKNEREGEREITVAGWWPL